MKRRSHRTRTPGAGSTRRYPRTARLNQLVQEIVAEEVERIDDERLGLLTIVAVEVETDLRHAMVWYSAMGSDVDGDGNGAGAESPVTVALAEHRPRLQAAIGSQARLKRTPELTFKQDTVIPRANRVEEILRDLAADEAPADEAPADEARAEEGPADEAVPADGRAAAADVGPVADTADTER